MDQQKKCKGDYNIFDDSLGLCNVLQPQERRLLESLLLNNENQNSPSSSPMYQCSSQSPLLSSTQNSNSVSPKSVSSASFESFQNDVSMKTRDDGQSSSQMKLILTRSDMQRLFGRDLSEMHRKPPQRSSNPTLPNVSPNLYQNKPPVLQQQPGPYSPCQNFPRVQKPWNHSLQQPNPMASPNGNFSTQIIQGSPPFMQKQDRLMQPGYPICSGSSGSMIKPSNNRPHGCSFCRNNKEVEEWFTSHQLKDNQGRVTCPVLRSYVCPLCCASGDNAHTVGHCPKNPGRRNSVPLAVRARTNAIGRRVIQNKPN